MKPPDIKETEQEKDNAFDRVKLVRSKAVCSVQEWNSFTCRGRPAFRSVLVICSNCHARFFGAGSIVALRPFQALVAFLSLQRQGRDRASQIGRASCRGGAW